MRARQLSDCALTSETCIAEVVAAATVHVIATSEDDVSVSSTNQKLVVLPVLLHLPAARRAYLCNPFNSLGTFDFLFKQRTRLAYVSHFGKRQNLNSHLLVFS